MIFDKLYSLLSSKNLDAVLITSKENTSYITGIRGFEGIVLVAKPGKMYCFTDSRYIEVAQKMGEERGFLARVSEGNNHIAEVAKICESDEFNSLGFEDKSVSVYYFDNLKRRIGKSFVGISSDLLKLRSVKLDREVKCIKAAQEIAERSLDTLLGEIKPGMTENQCKARLEYLMTVNGSENTSFSTILISGSKTSMPHGEPGDKTIQKGEFITFDFGAVVDGYCSDMTRTVALGYVTDDMRKVYDTVLNAQIKAVEKASPRISGAELDYVARDIIEKAGYGKYFGHALGHGVGIEVHEEPRVSPSNHNTLEVGNVITIEPGIYIPGVFGVRIEDMLFITEPGNTNLTNYSKNLIIL